MEVAGAMCLAVAGWMVVVIAVAVAAFLRSVNDELNSKSRKQSTFIDPDEEILLPLDLGESAPQRHWPRRQRDFGAAGMDYGENTYQTPMGNGIGIFPQRYVPPGQNRDFGEDPFVYEDW